ncbi:LmbE family N-acetylglucosaminyl deacetylase [Sulfuritortus calidifontis]|uniref:LmbE family N-acetylglucosaminyl deacetylase n=1 Tax=Sulfuritortus calidifontis TaxID=1914471 RepID=A0A4R3JVC7_9PROT|nr:glycosyltransferase [Sulfuritortus calidifontis]TCS71940.1 LmbE family N-acetylglucosaminyl deacetylase [Sulfuritortus calidifontis]
MRISIAMATYNGAKYLQEQLDSLAAQTLLPCELVICDDGSTDATLEIAERFAVRAPFPVRIHRNEKNLGYADNFLKAASLCEGDWIAFCDQDDVWLPHKLETVSRRFNNDVLLVAHAAIVANKNLAPGWSLELDIKTDSTKRPLQNRLWWVPPGFTQCVAKELTSLPHDRRPEDYNYPGRMQAHDQWFYFLANSLGNIAYIKEPLAIWRRHEATVTATKAKPVATKPWKHLTTAYKKHYLLLAGIANEYKKTMWALMHLLDQATALRAISYYNRMRLFHLARSLLYSRANFIVRARALLRIVLRNGYFGGDTAGLGARALAKDVFMLFLAGPIFSLRNLLTRALLERSLFFKKTLAHLLPSTAFPPGSALIVAPHPDDEVFACGGLIAHKLARHERIDILYMTQGEASHADCCELDRGKIAAARRQLARQALDTLGGSGIKMHWLDLPDDGVPAPGSHRFDEAALRVGKIIDDIKPSQILIPHELDTHSDHINTNAIVMAALKGRNVEVFSYPTWMLYRFRRKDLFRRVKGRAFKLNIVPGHPNKMAAIAIYENAVDPACPNKAPIIGRLPDTLMREFRNEYEVFFEPD